MQYFHDKGGCDEGLLCKSSNGLLNTYIQLDSIRYRIYEGSTNSHGFEIQNLTRTSAAMSTPNHLKPNLVSPVYFESEKSVRL